VKYNLVSRHTKEVVHTIDLSDDIGIGGARTFFIGTKKLDEKEFDKLWEVKYQRMSKDPIKWWEEEKAITDEELKIL
jgi:hypothetical protein